MNNRQMPQKNVFWYRFQTVKTKIVTINRIRKISDMQTFGGIDVWKYSGKSIYFKKTQIDIDTTSRIQALGGTIVKLADRGAAIDIIVFATEEERAIPNKALDRVVARQEAKGRVVRFLRLTELEESMGLDMALPFALWSQLPNFDPWSGKEIHPTRYNDTKVEES
ncbi:hypothetical protein [Lacticaseibacillus mingshuiensis]|uniref:Uncharacterized protein n=2 Tax=Lacticaseibacillus mingshuiensis TaxID=2799574 RepID=A0ABW4CHA7_9LACO|nr:hypothetical protein [Lacticaseibacillus mingshuiensis]